MGCGRTDAHVHASQYFFHADIRVELDFDLLFRLNKVLPSDIAVFDIMPVEDFRNARFDAISRTYDYLIHTYKDPFLTDISSYYPERKLDLGLMQKATTFLTQYNDFYAFCKAPNDNRTTLCQISSSSLYRDSKGDRIRFQISSNRFLRGMIRVIVDKLLQIGRGELSLDQFESHLIEKKSPSQIHPAYPQGLFLSKIVYPYLDLPTRSEFSLLHSQKQEEWVAI